MTDASYPYDAMYGPAVRMSMGARMATSVGPDDPSQFVRGWEMGRREPDTTARSYLHAIANDPERVEMAFAPTGQNQRPAPI